MCCGWGSWGGVTRRQPEFPNFRWVLCLSLTQWAPYDYHYCYFWMLSPTSAPSVVALNRKCTLNKIKLCSRSACVCVCGGTLTVNIHMDQTASQRLGSRCVERQSRRRMKNKRKVLSILMAYNYAMMRTATAQIANIFHFFNYYSLCLWFTSTETYIIDVHMVLLGVWRPTTMEKKLELGGDEKKNQRANDVLFLAQWSCRHISRICTETTAARATTAPAAAPAV